MTVKHEIDNLRQALLPTDNNQLLLQLKGPFDATKKVNRVDNKLIIQRKMKILHINLLKKYIEKKRQKFQPYFQTKVVSVCSVLGLLPAKDDSQEGQLDEYPQISSELVDFNPCLSTEQEKQVKQLL